MDINRGGAREKLRGVRHFRQGHFRQGRMHTPGHGPGFGPNFFHFAVASTSGFGSIAEEGFGSIAEEE